MSQIKTKVVTVRSVMGSAEFVRGFKDGKNHAPWPKDSLDLKDGWNYERGRMYGVLYPGIPPKRGRQVDNRALFLFVDAVNSGAII